MSAKEPTVKAKRFIENVAYGLPTRDAAIKAGYPEKSASSKGRSLAVDHATAIDKAVATRIGRKQGFALNIIVDLANNAENERVRLDAAKDILNRGAHVTGTRIDAGETQSLEQLIRALETQLGMEQTLHFLQANGIPLPERYQARVQTPDAVNEADQPETIIIDPVKQPVKQIEDREQVSN